MPKTPREILKNWYQSQRPNEVILFGSASLDPVVKEIQAYYEALIPEKDIDDPNKVSTLEARHNFGRNQVIDEMHQKIRER